MTAAAPQGPLSGYRVLEMGSTIAGPFCGRLFADFGAEVIKIEPREGDGVRSAGKRFQGKSLYAAFGAVMALLHRDRTGEGQYVDAALAEGAFSFIEPHVPAYDKLGAIANRAGSGIAGSVPNNLYPTKDGQYIHIQAAQNTVFRRFAPAIGMPELPEDARFVDAIARGRHQQELAGLTAPGLQALEAEGVVFCDPAGSTAT